MTLLLFITILKLNKNMSINYITCYIEKKTRMLTINKPVKLYAKVM